MKRDKKMKQGNGSDLLGANDPRASTIGIIYVAPNDDRDSVLTAILTQEKLGRKQIALVLPNQNKAFQRPVDFDGLKNMRRKLQAQLIIVAAQGSGPAEFARQRRFAFYTSLVNYKESLQEENEASRASRRGWFGGGNQKQSGADSDVEGPPLPANNHMSSPADDLREREDAPHVTPNVNAAALGLGMGAAGFAAGRAMDMHDDANDEHPMHYGDDDIQLPPGGSSPQSGSQSYPGEDDLGTLPPPHPAGPGADLEDLDTSPLSPQGNSVTHEPPAIPLPVPDDDYDNDPGAYSARPMRQGNTGPKPAVVPGVPVVVPRQGTIGGTVGTPPPPPVVLPGGGGNAGRPPPVVAAAGNSY
jgi:hypothetical protein